MTRELYDEICRVLTDYENEPYEKEVVIDEDPVDWSEEFYKVLVKVQNESEYA